MTTTRRRHLRLGRLLTTGAVLLSALLLSLSCDSTPSTGDGGGGTFDGGGGGTCQGGIDKSIDISTAIDLAKDTTHNGYICPVGDNDYFKVTIPAGDALIDISLKHTVKVSNVTPAYLVLDQSGNTVATAPAAKDKEIKALHCLAAGTYYILVSDDGNDARDGNNPYQLQYTTTKESDTNEPNNDVKSAKAISGNLTGAISCTGDIDYFKVSVGTNRLLEVKLTTSKASPVDIRYSIVDDKDNVVATQVYAEGTKGTANLVGLHHMPKAGTYYIKVEDDKSDDSDPTMSYTLTVAQRPEADPNDQGARNDTPQTATSLGTYSGGATLSRTITGQVGSQADVDWYKIDGLANVSPTNPAVIEVVLTYNASVPVDPSFSIVYGDRQSPCTKDSCCRVINPKGQACVNPFSCLRSSYTCIAKGDTFCTDSACGASGPNCATERRCAGAAVCLPGGSRFCGVDYAVRWRENGGTVKTAQPLIHPGPYYIRVGDLKNDEYANGVNYSLTVRVRMDPDGAKELDNEVFPDRCVLFAGGAAGNRKPFDFHWDVVKKRTIPTIALNTWVRGYISHEGDIDFYKFANPCPNATCMLRIDYRPAGSNCPSSGAMVRRCQNPNDRDVRESLGLEFLYTIRFARDGDQWTGFRTPSSATGSWGDPQQCAYSYVDHGSREYLITVEDFGFNSWSWSCGYEFRVVMTRAGCGVPPCSLHPLSGKCDK